MPIPIGPLPCAVPALATEFHCPRDILELELQKNQRLKIIEVKSEWWFIARTTSGVEGWVPAKRVRLLSPLINMSVFYNAWKDKIAIALGEKLAKDKDGKDIPHRKITSKTFPFTPPEICRCEMVACVLRKGETGLGACTHDIEALLKGVGEDEYCAKWLWGQSLMWHPDQFARKCATGWRDEGKELSGEMYKIFGELIEKERALERVKNGVA